MTLIVTDVMMLLLQLIYEATLFLTVRFADRNVLLAELLLSRPRQMILYLFIITVSLLKNLL